MVALDSVPAYSTFRCGDQGFAYNEAAFRHFLELERRRAIKSGRSLVLLLVKERMRAGRRPELGARDATLVFRGLGSSLREVDLIGWFRERVVAAAVVPLATGVGDDVPARLAARVERVLKAEMGQEQVARLRLRVARLGGKVRH